jgi:hypothetical protein
LIFATPGVAAAAPGPTGQASLRNAATSAIKGISAGCYAKGTKPFTLYHSSRNIYGEAKITSCFGHPTACHLGVDLEQYNGRTRRWHVVAHNAGKWRSCSKKTTQALYKNCTHDNTTKWYYRSSVYIVIEKGTKVGNVGHTYSSGNKFWCH